MEGNKNTQSKGKRKPGKKTGAAAKFFLETPDSYSKSGKATVNFVFLKAWLGSHAESFLHGISQFSRRYKSVNTTYAARSVLVFWAAQQRRRNWPKPGPTLERSTFQRLLASLRSDFYADQTKKGQALSTTTRRWSVFRSLLEDLVAVSAIPPISTSSAFLSSPSERDVLMDRSDAAAAIGPSPTAPKTLNREMDSYNDDLLEPISIIHSDVSYLEEYQIRLDRALNSIKACALSEFMHLEKLREQGLNIIEATGYEAISKCNGRGGRSRYADALNGKHLLTKNGGHPNLLGNILSLVHHEMGGIPQLHRKYARSGRTKTALRVGGPHWEYVSLYGKNKLLPYLGVMSSTATACCLILLLLEHPKLTATALYRACLEDSKGNSILLSSGGEGTGKLRMTVEKARAGEEKTVVLSQLAQHVIKRVLEWTLPVRKELIKQGRIQEARRLWVGINSCNFNLLAFSGATLLGSLRPKNNRSLGPQAKETRVVPFLERHPILAPWASKITFKGLRVNSGVLTYLRTDGDLVATAQAFGHKNVRTTISNYIPNALRMAIYDRQIRRHQNFLITSSLRTEQIMARASDFRTIEELHTFLNSYARCLDPCGTWSDLGDCQSEPSISDSSSADSNDVRVVISKDPYALAVAMLYRDALAYASEPFLNRRDPATGIQPRFWMEFIDGLLQPLPVALHEVRQLVVQALGLKQRLAAAVKLPEIG